MPSRKEASLSVITMVIILASAAVTFAKFGNSGIAQGQGSLTIGNLTITPEQKAAICNPNNPKLNFVNTTESKICGIPVTVKPPANVTSAANTTTTETQAPGVVPSLP